MNKIAYLSAILATTLAVSQSAHATVRTESGLRINNLVYHTDKNPTVEARHMVAVLFSTDLVGGNCDKAFFSDSNPALVSLMNSAMLAGKTVSVAYDDTITANWNATYCYILGVTVNS